MIYENLREEEIKNKVAQNYFGAFDATKIIGNVDFCVTAKTTVNTPLLFETESLLWAEAKKGKADIYKSIVQLILTIGKARTFDKFLPPAFLGAFDAEKIAFIPYNNIQDIFYTNDFNWTVTPSNHETKEFKLVFDKVKTIIDSYSLLFNFEDDENEIHQFIKENFVVGKSETSKIRIDKNNFTVIYNKWFSTVKPTISIDWEAAKKFNILDCDFYLADLLSIENESIKDKLNVLLQKDHYKSDKNINQYGQFTSSETRFNDNQKAHKQFWNKYDRPPNEIYWEYMVYRRELLVPQDVRERKGSYFTPSIWVEKSQEYLAEVLGIDWQDEYYIWDCAAGTGNLLAGLTNKYNIYASTLDRQDVDVMKDRIQNGANLLEANVFQFDFLNDSFDKLPKDLQNIINNPEKQKKLIVYINPPYAEAATANRKGNKDGVSDTKAREKYSPLIGNAVNELFAQFFAVIYDKLPDSILAQFSTLKFVQAPNFLKFRNYFKAEFHKGFVVQASSFDNVKGKFPIGFMIWNLKSKKQISKIENDVYTNSGILIGQKSFIANENLYINDWYSKHYDNNDLEIGIMNTRGNDFQNQNYIHISSINKHNHTNIITKCNLIVTCIYLTVRHVFKTDWINNRDQFLYPNDGWKKDKAFQNDCLTYALFHGQNKISSKGGINHWIPFTENEVNAHKKFESNFMTQFINGKMNIESCSNLFDIGEETKSNVLTFSIEAKTVFDAGRELYKYYHKQADCNVNSSLYDIREHFQGRNEIGRMNNKSEDETYLKLIQNLREALELLEIKLQPKVYEFGFLLK